MAEKILSLYIGKSHTLVSILDKQETGFALLYLKSLQKVLDITDLLSDNSSTALAELSDIMKNFDSIAKCFVSIDHSNCIFTCIPGNLFKKNKKTVQKEFLDLINLEIAHHDANKSIDDFRIKTIPINSKQANTSLELITIIDKNIILTLESILANFECELIDINSVPISAINAFMYNYPECKEDTVILAQICDDVLEFGILKNNNLIGYEFCIKEPEDTISTMLETQLTAISSSYSLNEINCIYYYGENLTKEQYLSCWESGMICSNDSKRLNPFRMLNAELNERDRDYCARTFQMYVACIGGALPIQVPVSVY